MLGEVVKILEPFTLTPTWYSTAFPDAGVTVSVLLNIWFGGVNKSAVIIIVFPFLIILFNVPDQDGVIVV